MRDVVVRFTANKREVGILKTSPQSADDTISEDEDLNGIERKKRYVSLKLNSTDKYHCRNVQLPARNRLQSRLEFRDDKSQNSNKTELIQKCNWDTKEDWESRKRQVKLVTKVRDRLENSISKSESKSTITPTSELKDRKSFTNLKIERDMDEKYLKHPTIESTSETLMRDEKSDSSEDESKRKHPNRRLQTERPDCDLAVKRIRLSRQVEEKHNDNSSRRLRSVVIPVSHKPNCSGPPSNEAATNTLVASMWKNVLDSPHLWEEETLYVKEKQDIYESESDDESLVDYGDMLCDFFLEKMDQQQQAKSETPYERRFNEMLEDPKFSDLVSEFYIPPALVEVFHQKLMDDQSAEESLKRLCSVRKWPKPKFTLKSAGRDGFLYSCTLKTKRFVPDKPASNKQLAKDLSALECLEWLGLKIRASSGQSEIENTYFA